MSLDMTIELAPDDPMGALFICNVTDRQFLLSRESEGFTCFILFEERDEPVLKLSTTHKTKRSTLIAKCLEYFEGQEDHQGGLVIKERSVIGAVHD